MIKIGRARTMNGLILFYRGIENHHTYIMKIWKNFYGFSFIEKDEHDKKVSCTKHYFKVSSWDYQTAFVYLRENFGLEK